MREIQEAQIFSVMAESGMGYIQARNNIKQRMNLGYAAPATLIGKSVQKRGYQVGSPLFENGMFEETIAGFVFEHDGDLMYEFTNGTKISCHLCIVL